MDLLEKTCLALLNSCEQLELLCYCPYKKKRHPHGRFICADLQFYGKDFCGVCIADYYLQKAKATNQCGIIACKTHANSESAAASVKKAA